MSIYLLFFQHILYNLAPNGRAAIVVPTGFISAQSGIEKRIRERLVERKWLKGVISMPSNIFANTGTNVSVIFVDKLNTDNKVVLIDASKLGKKVKDNKNQQRTILSDVEEKQIVNAFNDVKAIDNFSVAVSYDEITEHNYSFSAGEYFKIEIPHVYITEEEFRTSLSQRIDLLRGLLSEAHTQSEKIINSLQNSMELHGHKKQY